MLLDLVDIEADERTAGAELPSYALRYRQVRTNLVAISGQESWRGRQLEEHIDYVAAVPFDVDLQLEPTMRLVVLESTKVPRDTILNVRYVQPSHKPGTRPMLEVFCRV